MSDLNISDDVPKLEAPVSFLNTNNSALIWILVAFVEKEKNTQKKQSCGAGWLRTDGEDGNLKQSLITNVVEKFHF